MSKREKSEGWHPVITDPDADGYDPENDPDLEGNWLDGYRVKNRPPQGESLGTLPITNSNSDEDTNTDSGNDG